MLELKGITKVYSTGGDDVLALKGIDLKFRKSEFVSILGPSGCGKTTMLNIIGGLDQYTDGDLVINGTSTKEYKERDWDGYRNHSVGFVFQSYNLIPHQTVLQNVELALTLSGVKKAERRRRAIEALEMVGLGDKLRKHPNQMSGGQMQRVAIARAIVNNPDIILADEPTGALDTETSVQVMEILKEIAKDRLVIMVTHNPELAQTYSTRIVKMLDGKITDDSNPIGETENAENDIASTQEAGKKSKTAKKAKKPSMSFATSFGLSLKNLITKRGRTILTSFAGSIGIIGIALIYAVSNGTTNYIDIVQEQTLTSYPLTITETTVDITSLLTTLMGLSKSTHEHPNDAVYQKAMVYELINTLTSIEEKENDLKAFKTYVEKEMKTEGSKLNEAVSAVKYSYNLNFAVYTKDEKGRIIESDSSKLMLKLISGMRGISNQTMSNLSMTQEEGTSMSSGMMSQYTLWQELIPGKNGEAVSPVVKDQYELLGEKSRWPEAYNEIVLFVDEKNELDDMTLYALGLKSEEDILKIVESAAKKEEIKYDNVSWSYDDILEMDFRTILPCDAFQKTDGEYVNLAETKEGLEVLYNEALKLKVVGIVKPSENAVSASQSGSIGYTSLLTKYIIDKCNSTDIVKAQIDSKNTDIITGLSFKDENIKENKDKAAFFKKYAETLSDEKKSELYIEIAGIPKDEDVNAYVLQTVSNMTVEQIKEMVVEAYVQQSGADKNQIAGYIAQMSAEELNGAAMMIIGEGYKQQYAAKVYAELANMTDQQRILAFSALIDSLGEAELANCYDKIVEFSEFTYEERLEELGAIDLESPRAMNIYTDTFANKDAIKEEIEKYNTGKSDAQKIEYSDLVGVLMSSVTTIIDAITYVLIAFVSVSLIVSSIMIGVITLISVQERTKEIGILRAIGASKKNVSSMFNAETIIIGFTSGLLGVLITYLLCIPINLILHSLTGINSLSASLPIPFAIILVLISMFLTTFAGIIPSRSAAKKDPVVALRTE